MKLETKRFFKNKLKYIPLSLPILIIAVPLWYYFKTFGNFGLAQTNDNWAYFGEFLSPFAALSCSVVIVYLTFRLYEIEKNRETPILAVSVGKNSPVDSDAVTILNRSTFVAFDIRVIFMYNKEDDVEFKVPTLIPNDSVAWNIPDKEGLTDVVVEYKNAQGKILIEYPNTSVNKPYVFTMSDKEFKQCWFCRKRKIKPFKF
jgi:hypothetical protein